jgi:CRP/FNR family transcriptional regulator, cyclic AMP receptor protein
MVTSGHPLRAKRHTPANLSAPDDQRERSAAAPMNEQAGGTARVDIEKKLDAAWLTHGLAPEARTRLAQLGRLAHLAAGEVLMNEGEPTEYMGIVLDGRIALRMRVPERGVITIVTIEPGDVVGWSAVVQPNRATSTGVALAPTELVLFAGEELRQALAADDRLAAQFYPILLRAVARRLEGTRLQLLDLFTQRWVEPW